MSSSAPGTGPASRGSRLQLQLYVNEHPSRLQIGITSQIPELADVQIEWRSPLAESQPDAFHEMRDDEFLRALDLADRVDDLKRFWPVRGPQWDGLGVLHFPDGRRGELLVEAKANVPELLGGAATECKAGDVSRERIHKALDRTAQAIGARPPSIEAWLGPLYQTANRLAHLYFLREVLNRPDAWLLHILFEGDTTFKPTTRAQWKQALTEVDTALGLPSPVPHAGHVLVEALPKPAKWPA
jgi:hypothetical protein